MLCEQLTLIPFIVFLKHTVIICFRRWVILLTLKLSTLQWIRRRDGWLQSVIVGRSDNDRVQGHLWQWWWGWCLLRGSALLPVNYIIWLHHLPLGPMRHLSVSSWLALHSGVLTKPLSETMLLTLWSFCIQAETSASLLLSFRPSVSPTLSVIILYYCFKSSVEVNSFTHPMAACPAFRADSNLKIDRGSKNTSVANVAYRWLCVSFSPSGKVSVTQMECYVISNHCCIRLPT